MEEIKQLSEDIQELSHNLKEYIRYLKTSTDAKSWQEISQGNVKTKKFGDYYDKHFVISQAVASNPNDFDSPLYNIDYADPATLTTTSVRGATIFQETERYSDVVYVYNDGTTYDTNHYLYVTVSHGSMGLGHEEFVKPGESKAIYNVFELRFRSPTLRLPFRVSEYCIEQTCCPAAANTTHPVTISGQPIYTTISQLTPIEKANIHNIAVLATTNFLGTDITPTNTPCTFLIQIAMSQGGNLTGIITKSGNSQTVTFNVVPGPALVAGGLYEFRILVHSGDSINFQYSVNATIQIFRVQEADSVTGT